MATKQRRGSISRKTYFPKPQDMLEDREYGIIYECIRCHSLTDEVSGLQIKYAILLGRANADLAEELDMLDDDGNVLPIITFFNNVEASELLNTIGVIVRKGKSYTYDLDSGTWKEPALTGE